MKRYRDAGINRVSASLPFEKTDTILPMLDQWVAVMRAVNGKTSLIALHRVFARLTLG